MNSLLTGLSFCKNKSRCYLELYETDRRVKKIKQNLQQSLNNDGIKTCFSRQCITRIRTSNSFYLNY